MTLDARGMQQQRRLLDELLGPDRNDLPKEDRRRGRRGKLRFKAKKAEGVGSLKRRGKRGKALGSETNAGVSLRNRADLLELQVEERRKSEALERKARLYDKITRGEVEPPSNAFQVNFKAKGTAQPPPPPPPRLSEPSRNKPRLRALKPPSKEEGGGGGGSANIAKLKAKISDKARNKY